MAKWRASYFDGNAFHYQHECDIHVGQSCDIVNLL